MDDKNWKNIIKEHALIILLFTALAFIMTYPVIAQISTHAAGDGGDGFDFKWIIWHISQVLAEGGGIYEIYYSDLMFYPYGASLEWNNLTLTNALFFAFPLTLITNNLVLIYNTLFLFNFIMAGYAMYLLIKYLTKDRATAFLVGFAYTFSPLHMTWGYGFFHLISFLWTPLFFLFFFKMFEEEKMKNTIIAAIFLFFLALASWGHLLFVFFITVPYFIYKLITARHLFTKHFFIRISVFLILFYIIILPFLIPMIDFYFAERLVLNWPGPTATMITPVHYLLPLCCHPLWGNFLRGSGIFWEYTNCGAEDTVTPGYLIIIISFAYLLIKRKHIFWILFTLFFFLLSVVPENGLLMLLLRSIPFVDMMGVISRFSFGVLFSLLLFSAFALSYFLFECRNKLRKRVLTGIIFAIMITEYLFIPYPTTHGEYQDKSVRVVIESAEEIARVLSESHPLLGDNFVILNLPSYLGDQYGLYHQTFHKKPIIGGNVARPRIAETRALRELNYIIRTNNVSEFQEFLKNYNVGYIVLYYKMARLEMSLVTKTPLKLVSLYPGDIYIFEVLPGNYLPE